MKSDQTAIDRFQLDQRWRVEGKSNPLTALNGVAQDQQQAQRMPMWLFVSDGFRVLCRNPVEVTVVSDGDSVELNCDRLHVFASGSSYDDALSELHEQVVYFYRHYTSHDEGDFIGEARELWRLYGTRFEVTTQA